MRAARWTLLGLPICVAAFALVGCGAPAPAVTSPAPTTTSAAEPASDCDTALDLMRETQAALLAAMEPAGEAGNTEDRSADLEPVIADLRAHADASDDAELSTAVRALADTVDAFRTALFDIAAIRATAQAAEAIVAVDESPEIVQAATDVLESANVALNDAAGRVATLGGDFATSVQDLSALCA